MAWYSENDNLLSIHIMLEQNITDNSELISWRNYKLKPSERIYLQAYYDNIDCRNGDTYLFSLRRSTSLIDDPIYSIDITYLVQQNQRSSANTIRTKIINLINNWWLNSNMENKNNVI